MMFSCKMENDTAESQGSVILDPPKYGESSLLERGGLAESEML